MGCSLLKVSAVGHWDYYSEENKVISEVQYQASLEVKRGYLLATRANADPDSVGRTCLVQCTRSGLMLSDKTWRIKLKNPKIASGILAWTKSSIFRKNIFKKLSGTEAKNVSQKDFLDSPFPSCSKEELQAFNSEIEVLLRNELELKNRSNNSRNFFKTLINQILGK